MLSAQCHLLIAILETSRKHTACLLSGWDPNLCYACRQCICHSIFYSLPGQLWQDL